MRATDSSQVPLSVCVCAEEVVANGKGEAAEHRKTEVASFGAGGRQ